MHEVQANGVMICRTATGVGVGLSRPHPRPLLVEVDYLGRRLREEWLDPSGPPWRDCYEGVDMLRVVVRVKDGPRVLAELSLPGEEYPLPFMVLQGGQRHVTESSVSVPPALTITSPRGDVFTLGFRAAPRGLSPDGEFAFDVLKNGSPVGENASRIEIRNGQVRIFTHAGWKKESASGREFL